MTVFRLLLLCCALIVAPAMSAHASELGSVSDNDNNEVVVVNDEDSFQGETFAQQDYMDSETFDSLSDNSVSSDSAASEESESGYVESDSEDGSAYDVMPLSDYETYYGSISSTYVEYMRGYLPKLGPSMHYVGARSGQYEYIFAYGDNLEYDSGYFSGNDIRVCTWNTQNSGSFSSVLQSSFSLNAGSYLVYTDLGFDYPSLATSSDFSLRQIVMVVGIFVVYHTLTQFMRTGGVRFGKKRRRKIQ